MRTIALASLVHSPIVHLSLVHLPLVLVLPMSIRAQSPPPPRAAAFSLPELRTQLEGSGKAWQPFLTRRSLSCGIYRIAKGASDGQPAHDLDEIY